jgi:hypothetical protein
MITGRGDVLRIRGLYGASHTPAVLFLCFASRSTSRQRFPPSPYFVHRVGAKPQRRLFFAIIPSLFSQGSISLVKLVVGET